MPQLQQIPVLIPFDVGGIAVPYAGPAGLMGGGANFTVGVLARLDETLGSLAAKTNIAKNTDGAAKGWEIFRAIGSDALSVKVYNAGGSTTLTTGSLRGRGRHLACIFLVCTPTTVSLYINGTLIATGATPGGNPVVASTDVLVLGEDVVGFPTWAIAAFGYRDNTNTSFSDNTIQNAADSALAFGQLLPFGVASSVAGIYNGVNLSWDYIYDAKDLVDSSNPGGIATQVTDQVVAITATKALTTWPSAWSKTANQPNQPAAATAGVVLTAQGGTALLGQASLIWMQLDPSA